MAVLYPGDELFEGWGPRPTTCFYCGGDLREDEVLIYWYSDHLEFFHPPCAEQVGTDLIADSREAWLATGGPHWSRRAARALRVGLAAQEMAS